MLVKYAQISRAWLRTADQQLLKQLVLAILKIAFEAFDSSPFAHSNADTAAFGADIQKDFSALKTKDSVIRKLHATVWTAFLRF